MAHGGKLASIRGFASKLAEHAGRLAAVVALFADPSCTSVSAEAMSAGIDLANHYASEALRLNDEARIADQLRVAEKLRQWLADRGKAAVYPAEIYQLGPSELRTKTDAMTAIRILVDHGFLSPMHGSDNRPVVLDGVTRKEAWRVHDADGNPIGGTRALSRM